MEYIAAIPQPGIQNDGLYYKTGMFIVLSHLEVEVTSQKSLSTETDAVRKKLFKQELEHLSPNFTSNFY